MTKSVKYTTKTAKTRLKHDPALSEWNHASHHVYNRALPEFFFDNVCKERGEYDSKYLSQCLRRDRANVFGMHPHCMPGADQRCAASLNVQYDQIYRGTGR